MMLEEFKRFMNQQVAEMINYKNEIKKYNPDLNSNECYLRWIHENAKKFRDNWTK